MKNERVVSCFYRWRWERVLENPREFRGVVAVVVVVVSKSNIGLKCRPNVLGLFGFFLFWLACNWAIKPNNEPAGKSTPTFFWGPEVRPVGLKMWFEEETLWFLMVTKYPNRKEETIWRRHYSKIYVFSLSLSLSLTFCLYSFIRDQSFLLFLILLYTSYL